MSNWPRVSMVSEGGGWLVVALVATVAAIGCEGAGPGPSSAGSSSDRASEREASDSESDPEETEPEAESGKRAWEQRIRRQLERSADDSRPAAGGEAAECRLFPDSCGEGESCFVGPSGERRCAAFDPEKALGDRCGPDDRCDAGQQCVGGASSICLESCLPGAGEPWGCPADRVCSRVLGPGDEPFDWGVCRPIVDRCRPWPEDDCTIDEACVTTRAGRRCRQYRDGADPGDSCANSSDCRIGQVCVVDENGFGTCRHRCNEDHPCNGADCQPLPGRDVGFCPGDSRRAGSRESESRSITGF